MIERIKNYFDKHALKILMILTVILSVSSLVWVYFNNYAILYIDAASHLNIARRVIDNLTPGFAQLGGIWLPIPHLLMLPFIWNDFMWHSGLAGIIVSVLSFIGISYFTFKLVNIITNDRLASFLASLIIIINPNILYLQATPMGEMIFIFFVVASMYYIAKWHKTANEFFLISAAFFALLASLSRYEGWFVILVEIIIVAIVAYKKRGWKSFEGNILMFATFAGFGPLLWLFWSFLILGDPLYFMHSQYSASGQQEFFKQIGKLPTNHNLFLSFKYYFLDIAETNGWLFSLLAAVGSILIVLKEKLKIISLLLSVGGIIIFFEILSLYKGVTIIYLPQLPPFALFNTRYGIYVIQLISMVIGYAFFRSNLKIRIVILTVFFAQGFLFFSHLPITFQDPLNGMNLSGSVRLTIADFIKQNYDGGKILTATGKFDSVVYFSGLPIKYFIHEGNGHYWSGSLKNPEKYARWIIMSNSKDAPLDDVAKELYGTTKIADNYNLVFEKKGILIYKIKK